MNRMLVVRVGLFVVLIWGAWLLIEQPGFVTTRRPSSLSALEDPRQLMKNCHEKARELFPTLAQNLKLRADGSFEDHKSFYRSYRVRWEDQHSEWLLEQGLPDDLTGEGWQALARFWDVNGDAYPDEALLIVDPVHGRDWARRIDFSEWSVFSSLKKDGKKLAWMARLQAQDWSPEGECYAWANPVTVMIDWAMMNFRWTPSLAL
jgi:hypothetical protein